jgi:hypothetical protein
MTGEHDLADIESRLWVSSPRARADLACVFRRIARVSRADGMRDAAELYRWQFGDHDRVADWLRARADEIEKEKSNA